MKDAKEQQIEEIGAGIYRLALPIPFEVGPINCYLLLSRGEGPVLVDTGPKTRGARGVLHRLLGELGVRPADLRHLILTHSHIDHHGLAGELQLAGGARVHAHEADSEAIFAFTRHVREETPRYLRLATAWGFGGLGLQLVSDFRAGFLQLADDIDRRAEVRLQGLEGPVAVPGWELRFLHTPGHSAGHICLWLPAEDLVLVGDHILEDITPNPAVYLPPYRGKATGLGDYLESLERFGAWAPPGVRLAPGHGRLFGGLGERLATIAAHHRQRKARIVEVLREGPGSGAGDRAEGYLQPARAGLTVADIASRLWRGLSPGDFYLAAKEVHGHLDLLVAEGRVVRVADGEVWGFAATDREEDE